MARKKLFTMRKLIIFMIGMFILIILSIGSYKKLNSSHYQSILLYDFNNGTDFFNLEDSKFDDKYLIRNFLYVYGHDNINELKEKLV